MVRRWVETAVQDARYGIRTLRHSAGFATTAVLSLGIGIGATTTIFSIGNALLVRRPPGLADPARLIDIGRTMRGGGFDTASYPNYRDIRDRATTLDGVYAYELEPRAMSLGGNGEAERVYGVLVTGNYFPVLGARPTIGRLLEPDDDRPGTPLVAVISHELWQRRFSQDPAVLGREIVLNGTPFTVAGVAPEGFQGTTLLRSEVWVPIAQIAAASPRRTVEILTQREASWLVMGARLKPGTSLRQANAELMAIGAALEREFPRENRDHGYAAARSTMFPGQASAIAGFVGVLMAITGLVLLIACVNISGMVLARSAARRREIALRTAMGAGRGRLVRQVLTETAVLFAAGGIVGLLLSGWLTALLQTIVPQLPVPVSLDVATDWRVGVFAAALSVVACLVAGLVPALQTSRADLVLGLKSEGLSGHAGRLRARNAFVVAQLAMSLLLMICAGLLMRSVQRAAGVDPGFDQANVDVVSLDLSLARYGDAAGRAFVTRLLERLRASADVQSVSVAADLPLDGGRMSFGRLTIQGVELPPGLNSFPADWNIVEPEYFSTLRIPLVRGRDFTRADNPTSPRVAIVNAAFARRAWGDTDPIGRTVRSEAPFGEATEWTIVGVAADAKLVSLASAGEPYIYVPFGQMYMPRMSVLARRSSGSAIPQIRALVRELNPNLPVTVAMPLATVTSVMLVPVRIAAWVAGTLGVLGLLLSAIGIYGLTAFSVGRRAREIGIRIALGAEAGQVLRLVLRQAAVLACLGIAAGVVLAVIGSRLLASLLFGVSTLDPVTFGAACLLIAGATMIASFIPARRATKVAPIVALRVE